MSFTYSWFNPEQTILKIEDEQGCLSWADANDPDDRNYQWFCNCGATAAPYVAPPAPKAETTEEKVNHLLSDYGLTRDELLKAVDASSQ